MDRFSNEAISQMGYYVYRLVDPRNGQTFYVGNGKGNRIFAHAKCALASYENESYKEKDEDEISAKYKVIREIAADLKTAGIEPLLSDFVQRDTLKKYAYVSPMAAAGLYFDADAGAFQKTGAPRDTFAALMREIDALAIAMGCPFDTDIVQTNLDILDALAPDASTSMQRDIRAGHQSELDGLVFEPVRLGRKYGVPTPQYAEIAAKFGFVL